MTKDTHGTNDYWERQEKLAAFSFFLKPIHNIEPYRAITVVDVYRYVTGHYAKKQSQYLQPIITQYFIDNKSEIWLLFLIAHSKR